MTTAESSSAGGYTIYSGGLSFINWNLEITRLAKVYNVWAYLDPDNEPEWPEEPIERPISAYDRKKPRPGGIREIENPATLTQLEKKRLENERLLPDLIDHDNPPVYPSDLTKESAVLYERDQKQHDKLLTRYNLLIKAFAIISDRINQTVAEEKKSLLRNTVTCREMYLAVYNHAKIYVDKEYSAARTAFQHQLAK